MIIDLKYHIVTLVAVFLALGVGIFIGSAMIGNDYIAEQQKQFADRLEKDFETLREQNRESAKEIAAIQDDAADLRQFSEDIMAPLITNRLIGRSVAVIETSNYSMNSDLINALKKAGAKVLSVTTILNGLTLPEQNRAALAGELGLGGINDRQLLPEMARKLAAAIFTGETERVAWMDRLEELGLIQSSGVYGGNPDSILIIGGAIERDKNYTKKVDLPLIRYYTDQGVKVFGAEHSKVAVSYMQAYQQLEISTVDNVDTIPGQVALILALDNHPGDYGIKPTAKQFLPEIEPFQQSEAVTAEKTPVLPSNDQQAGSDPSRRR